MRDWEIATERRLRRRRSERRDWEAAIEGKARRRLLGGKKAFPFASPPDRDEERGQSKSRNNFVSLQAYYSITVLNGL